MVHREPQGSSLSISLTVALATSVAYLAALFYQVGWAEHFGLPSWCLDFSQKTIVWSAYSVFVGLFPILALAALGVLLVPWDVRVWRDIGVLFFVGLISLTEMRVTGAGLDGSFLLPAVIGYCFGSLVNYLVPTNRAKFLSRTPLRLGDTFRRLMSSSAALYITLSALSVFMTAAYGIGVADAREQTDFWVVRDSKQFVLGMSDRSSLLLAGFDPQTKTLTGDLAVLNLESGAALSTSKASIGPLARAEPGKHPESRFGGSPQAMLKVTLGVVGMLLSVPYALPLPRRKAIPMREEAEKAEDRLPSKPR